MKLKTRFMLAVDLLLVVLLLSAPVLASAQTGSTIFLPNVTSYLPPPAAARTVNIPYINDSTYQVTNSHMPEMAIFWFGQVTPNDNYTDVRIAYNNTDLVISTSTFDRSLWYNPNSTASDLESWDAVAVTIQTDAGNYHLPQPTTHRFVAGLRFWEEMSHYKRQYQGSGTGWNSKTPNFSANTIYRGEIGFNVVPPAGNALNRGWVAHITIPFSTLGLSGPPPAGSLWRIHTQVYDRDNPNSPGSPKVWPESSSINIPSTWANLRFGLPSFSSPPLKGQQFIELKNNIANIRAPDAQVGGAFTCGTTENFFDVWGTLNYSQSEDQSVHINIQNQSDVSDFPCYSKYYITFSNIPPPPPGKIIRSAKLVMTLYGGSDPQNAQASWIQVFTVSPDWNEAQINWNNAPLAIENLGNTVVNVVIPNWNDPETWSKLPRYEWDVTRAVDRAYNLGLPVSLALYSADSAYHSGKYFVSSDTDVSWNARNLPALVIEYVDP